MTRTALSLKEFNQPIKAMFKVNLIYLITFCFIVSLSTVNADMLETSSDKLATLIEEGAAVVDVRTPDEWRTTGVIAESHLLTFFDDRGNYNLNDWLSKFTKLADPEDEVVIICAVGNRSQVISQFLSSKLGYQKVHNVTQGIEHWIGSGHPVNKWP